MQDHRITAYEGTENYIFISYAHKDTDIVFPILSQLQARGYRIWYDDGIAPGSEWPENIAQHLNGAAMTMAFISPNSMASPNCRREINFALSRQKAFLSVVLNPTEMPLGMELQLSAQQSVIRYNYRTEEQFIQKICACPDLACCQKQPELPKQEPVREEAPAKEPVREETPVQKLLPVSAKPEKLPKPPKPKKQKTTKSPKKPGKKLGIAVGVLALIVLASIVISAINTVKITEEKSVKKRETYLLLRDLTVDAAMLEQLGKLKKLEALGFTRCYFEADALAQWSTAAPLRYVTLEDCEGDVNLNFLGENTTLRTLDVKNSGLTDENMPSLHQSGLYKVCLNGNPDFTDPGKLAGLEGLRELEIANTGVKSLESLAVPTLQKIDFSGTPVTDVAVLANCPALTAVTGSDSQVTDIAPLARLAQLESLKFANCDLSGLSPELRFESLRLSTLDLENSGITTLEPFSDLTQLTAAYLGYNDLNNTQLQILAKSAETLKYLDISGTGFQSTGAPEDAWISKCWNLKELYLDNTRLTDLYFVQDMTALTTLSAWNCGLQDISRLGICTELVELCLAENDMENLDGLEQIQLEPAEFACFDFTGCEKLTDISGLPEANYAQLCLAGCPNIDYGTAGNVSGSHMTLNYSTTFAGSKLGTNTFGSYYFLDCPTDQKVAMENLLGSYRVTFVADLSELAQIMAEKLRMSCDHLKETMAVFDKGN